MHYILFYDVVSDYLSKRAQFRNLHLEHVRRAYERGELILAGALADPVDGAVLVFNGPTPDSAEAFAKADPYVTNGLVTGWRVRKWMTVIGEGATPPEEDPRAHDAGSRTSGQEQANSRNARPIIGRLS